MRIRIPLLMLALTLAASSALNSTCFAADNDGCSNATLRGNYGFTILGDQPNPDGTTSPVVGVAITHFDGAGKLTQKDFTVEGGIPSPANGTAATSRFGTRTCSAGSRC